MNKTTCLSVSGADMASKVEAKVCVVSITQAFRRLQSLSEAEIDAWLKTARTPTYGASCPSGEGRMICMTCQVFMVSLQ